MLILAPEPQMSTFLLAASILILATGCAHSFLGELLILRFMVNFKEVPALLGSIELTKQTLRFTWHLPTLLASGMALILFRYASLPQLGNQEKFVINTISGALLACFFVTLAVSRGRHPGWVTFLLSAALAWIGSR
jgi:hypothetical protein